MVFQCMMSFWGTSYILYCNNFPALAGPDRDNHTPSQWRHNEPDGISNHRRLDYLFNHLFRRRTKKTSKLRVTGLFEGNPRVAGGFPPQRASNAKKFPIDGIIMPVTLLIFSTSLQIASSWYRPSVGISWHASRIKPATISLPHILHSGVICGTFTVSNVKDYLSNLATIMTSSNGNIFRRGYWPIMRGSCGSPVNSPHKGLWRGALMFSLICGGGANNRDAGDLKCHRDYYDVTVMISSLSMPSSQGSFKHDVE